MSFVGNGPNNISNDRVTSAVENITMTERRPSDSSENTNRQTGAGEKNADLPENVTNEKDAADTALVPQFSADHDIIPAGTDLQFPPEFNKYRNKKTLTQGLMDIALFSANANQLRFLLENSRQMNFTYSLIIIILIILSLILQIAVGFLLLSSTRYNVCVEAHRKKIYRWGNYSVYGIFLITVINIFIAAFGGPQISALAPETRNASCICQN